MRRGPLFVLATVAGFAAAAIAAGCQPTAQESTAEAVAPDSAHMIAFRLLEQLGGSRSAFDDTRYVAFNWVVEREGEVVANRAHGWDKYTGRYRFSFTDRNGAEHLAILDVDSVSVDAEMGKIPVDGGAWRDAIRLRGASRDSALAGAYRGFINDSYWLLMPYKWLDPGVHLAYEGMRTLSDGRAYQTVRLSYDEGLGVTNDQFWGFVDPETGMMSARQYHLEGRDEPGAVVWWEDWRQVGPLKMSANRRFEQPGGRIYFTDLASSSDVPPGAFDGPDATSGTP